MVYNWGKDFVTLGTVGTSTVPICRGPRPEIAVVQYDYFGLLWLFTFACNRRYLRVCSECKRGHAVEQSSLGGLAESDNIPFMRKFGLVVFAAIIAVIAMVS